MNFAVKKFAPSSVKQFQRALEFLRSERLDEAEKIFRGILRLEPKAIDVRLNLGYIAFKRGDYSKAHELFSDVLKDDPNNVTALNSFAVAAMRIRYLEEAEKALLKSLEIIPDHFDSYINLCALSGYQGKEVQGLHYAVKAISIKPDAANAYINLGSCLQNCNRLEEAAHAFETALVLDKHQLSAIINLGVICAKLGKYEKAIAFYDNAISLAGPTSIERVNEANFYKSVSLLNLGRLKEAWALYDCGFFPSLTHGRSPKRTFNVPQWRGEKLQPGEALLCWKEQGIGDELMFLSCLSDLEQIVDNIIVECDPRIVSALSRSFPKIRFREATFQDDLCSSAVHHDYSYHVPFGSMFGLLRQDLSCFSKSAPFIKPIDSLVEKYKSRIGKEDGRLKVGICWRSGQLSALRNSHYTSISEWGPIFSSRPDADFFSLQYGDCQDELRNANESFGIHVNWWPDIDYKNSFEDLFALAKAVDVVVTVGTAVGSVSACVGTPTILMTLPSWTSFGTDRLPPLPAIRVVRTTETGRVTDLIPEVAELLKSFATDSDH